MEFKKVSDMLPKFNGDEMSDIAFLEMKANAINNEVGQMEYFDCKVCLNKGYIAVLNDEELRIKKCECSVNRVYHARMERSGMGNLLKLRIADYEVQEKWQKVLKEKTIKFLTSDKSKWFALVGQVGSGKTTLCSIVANELLKEKKVYYETWGNFTSSCKRKQNDELENYLWEIKNSEVLFMDDILKGYTEYDLRLLFDLINYRYNKDLQTLITSEKSRDELLTIDQATFSRIAEKCDDYFISIKKDLARNQRIKGEEV